MIAYSDVHADFISWVMGAVFFASIAYLLFITLVRNGEFKARQTYVHKDSTRPDKARRVTDEVAGYVETKMQRLK